MDDFEKEHLRHLRQTEKKIKKLYEASIQEIVVSFSQINYNGQIFLLKDYPALLRKIEAQIKKLRASIYATTINSIEESWDLSNQKNNIFVDKRLAGKKPKKRQILYDPNLGALNSFLQRKVKGLNLSDRVWNTLDGYKTEMETALGVGVSEGRSANEMANGLKRFLNEPDRLFRRIRQDDGSLKLSRAAMNYHPGQGVYRSSFLNAKRLARTEVNASYRNADIERWRTLPFVKAYRINLSNNHIIYDICDELEGVYPLDFNWTEWHPQCLCYLTAEQMSDAEYIKYEDDILAGRTTSVSKVTELPKNFINYVGRNADRINGWKSKPRWFTNNEKRLSDTIDKPIRAVMRKAKQSGPEIDEIGKDIAKKYDGTVTPINFKSKDSIKRKVYTELGGELGQLKDSVRNTVVVPYKDLEKVVADLKTDSRFTRVKLQDGPEYYGYKGVITNVQTKNGTIAEMQVNSPGMIYAKVPKEEALRVMSEDTYNNISKVSGLEGGRGHYYYEEIRVINPATASPEQILKRDRLITESNKYYSKFYGF